MPPRPAQAWPRACRRALCCQELPSSFSAAACPSVLLWGQMPDFRRPQHPPEAWRRGPTSQPPSPVHAASEYHPLGGAVRVLQCSLHWQTGHLLPRTPSPGLGPRGRGPGLPAASQGLAPGCWYWGAGQGEDLRLQPHPCRPGSGQSPHPPGPGPPPLQAAGTRASMIDASLQQLQQQKQK